MDLLDIAEQVRVDDEILLNCEGECHSGEAKQCSCKDSMFHFGC